MTVIDIAIARSEELALDSGRLAIWWLGQAGFLLRCRQGAIVIDPYLSDSLAVKYRGQTFEHVRMMPVPVKPSRLTGVNWVFSSHRHTDHMDVGTLPPLLAANPGCRYFCPASAADHAATAIGIDPGMTTLLDAGDRVTLADGVEVDVLASAHEELQYDADGHSLHLGFAFNLDGTRVYHSGDCAPYDGLAERLRAFDIDVALLPVNGRDAYRTSNRIIGNFTFDEALALCGEAGIPAMVPHHFGMFDFNTLSLQELQKKIEAAHGSLDIKMPEIDRAILTGRTGCKT